MNRRDFETLARALKGARPEGVAHLALYHAGWVRACEAIAAGFQVNVAGFESAKFLKQCGVPRDNRSN